MTNKTATIKTTITYSDENDHEETSTSTVYATYMSSGRGELDVADATAGATAISIPFGSIAKATAVWVKNKTGQQMILKINGSAALNSIPINGELLIAAAALGASADLTAVSLTTTGTQSGAGTIAYKVFGDPIAP